MSLKEKARKHLGLMAPEEEEEEGRLVLSPGGGKMSLAERARERLRLGAPAAAGVTPVDVMEPRPVRGVLDAVLRGLLVGEAATAGGVRETGLLPETPRLGALVVPKAALTRPGEFARGALRGIKAGYDWTEATREIAPPGTPEWQTAAAGLTRGIAYDPLTYLGPGLIGKALRAARRGRAVARPAAELGPPSARFGRETLERVGGMEREARRVVQEEKLPAAELGRRLQGLDQRTGEAVTKAQRAMEDAATAVFRAETERAGADVKTMIRGAGLAAKTSRRMAAKARGLRSEARQLADKAYPVTRHERIEQLLGEAMVAGEKATTPAQARGGYEAILDVLEEMGAGAKGGGAVEVLQLGGKGAGRGWKPVSRTVGYDLAQAEDLARRAGFASDREGLEAFAERLYDLASEGGVAERRFRFPGKVVRDFAESDMRFTGLEARAAARGVRGRIAETVELGREAAREARGLTRRAGRLARATPVARTYARIATSKSREAESLAVAALEAAARSDSLMTQVERASGVAFRVNAWEQSARQAIRSARNLAERGAIPAAHKAARQGLDLSLTSLERTAGKEAAQEVRRAIGELQAFQKPITGRAIGARLITKEGAQKWGDIYLWRGFEKHLYPEEYVARLRLADPELAAHIEAHNARMSRVLGAVGAGGVPRAARMPRKLLGREALTGLGELPVGTRVVLGERISAAAASEANRLRSLAQTYGRTLDEFLDLPEREMSKWLLLEEGQRFGPLLERPAVPKWLAAHLGLLGEGSGWEHTVARWQSWLLPARPGELTRARDPARQAVLEATKLWKWTHTAGNLPTQARNSFTNALMTYLVGKIPAAEVPVYLVKGLLATARRSPAFRLALRTDPGFSATLSRTELGIIERAAVGGVTGQTAGNIFTRLGRFVYQKAGRLYEVSEQSAKMAVFLYHTEHGMDAARAGRLAMQAVFDYGDVSRVTNWLRRWGVAPFVTFPVKATKALVPAMVTEPGRFATLAKTIRAPGYARYTEERGVEAAAMPEYMPGRMMRLPLKTAQGETLYLDIGYILPWGPWGEGLSVTPLQLAPLPRIVEDLFRNQNSFTGRRIYEPEMPKDEIARAAGDYLGESLGPGWVMRGIPRIVEAAEGRGRYRYGAPAEQRELGPTVAGELFGVRTRPLLPRRETAVQSRQAGRRRQELAGVIRDAQRRGRADVGEITPGQRDRIVGKARLQLKALQVEERERKSRYKRAAGP